MSGPLLYQVARVIRPSAWEGWAYRIAGWTPVKERLSKRLHAYASSRIS